MNTVLDILNTLAMCVLALAAIVYLALLSRENKSLRTEIAGIKSLLAQKNTELEAAFNRRNQYATVLHLVLCKVAGKKLAVLDEGETLTLRKAIDKARDEPDAPVKETPP